MEVAEAATTVPATPTASTPDQGLGAPLYGMDDPKRIPGSYLVAMKKDNQLKASLSAFSAVAGLSMTSQYVMKGFQGFAAKMTDTALEQIRKNPNVAYVEANRIISLEKPTNAKVETDSITSLAFPASWGQDRVDQHDLCHLMIHLIHKRQDVGSMFMFLIRVFGEHIKSLVTALQQGPPLFLMVRGPMIAVTLDMAHM